LAGQEVSEWEKIAGAGVEYYTQLFASKQRLDKSLLDDILESYRGKISEEDKYIMDTRWHLGELTESTQKMAKNRAPRPDGAPIKFFISQWGILGPLEHPHSGDGSIGYIPSNIPAGWQYGLYPRKVYAPGRLAPRIFSLRALKAGSPK
jgi:hypothetical protein